MKYDLANLRKFPVETRKSLRSFSQRKKRARRGKLGLAATFAIGICSEERQQDRSFRNLEIPIDIVLLHRLKKHHPDQPSKKIEQTQRNTDPYNHRRSSTASINDFRGSRVRQHCTVASRILRQLYRAHHVWWARRRNRNIRLLGLVRFRRQRWEQCSWNYRNGRRLSDGPIWTHRLGTSQ
jgi:hypothetical protein